MRTPHAKTGAHGAPYDFAGNTHSRGTLRTGQQQSGGMARSSIPAEAVVLAVVFLVVIVMLAIAIAVSRGFDERAGRAFSRIAPGDSEAAVVALMGRPDREVPCYGAHSGENGTARCATEARYEYFLSTWVVDYTAQRRVLDKHHNVSD